MSRKVLAREFLLTVDGAEQKPMSEAKSSVLLSFLPFHDTYPGLFPLTSDVDTLVSRCEAFGYPEDTFWGYAVA